MTDFQKCKKMNSIIVTLLDTETLVMLSIVYIMTKHSWKRSYTATLRHFIFKFFWGGGEGGETALRPLKGPKILF